MVHEQQELSQSEPVNAEAHTHHGMQRDMMMVHALCTMVKEHFAICITLLTIANHFTKVVRFRV
jgi:hypothetical protein